MSHSSYPVGTCRECGKRSFVTRKAARGFIRRVFPGEALTVYQCGDYWHYGHISYEVSRGTHERRRISA